MQKTSHAIFHRIYVRLGLAAALVGSLPLNAYAAYANLSPPPGWSQGGSAAWATASNGFAAQTANQWINNAAKTSAMLNVGGKQVAVQASLALGPSAPKVIAGLIFSNPYLRAGVGIASWLGTGKVIYDAASGSWSAPQTSYPVSDGQGWYAYDIKNPRSSPEQACRDITGGAYGKVTGPFDDGMTMSCYKKSGTDFEFVTTMRKTSMSSCPSGWFITPAGCVQTVPPRQLTQKEMVDLLNPANTPGWPMPSSVPNELPIGTPLPVQLPVVNPDTGVNPFPKPMFVPTGDPVRNPNYNPDAAPSPTNQPFIQPGTNVTPRPTTANPWQVDVQPVDRPQAGPDPLPENPKTDPNDKPREENEKSLCEKHPDILACQKPDLDTPDGDIPKTSRDVSLQEENLFGGGSCPADVYFSPQGLQQMKVWDWNKACGDISTYLKPILIICCTFAAFMILVPGRTE